MILADVRSIKLGATPIIAVHVGAVKVWPVFVPDFHGQFRVQPGSLELRLNLDGSRPGPGVYTVEVVPYPATIPHPDWLLGTAGTVGTSKIHFTDEFLSTSSGALPGLRDITAADAAAAWAGHRLRITVIYVGGNAGVLLDSVEVLP